MLGSPSEQPRPREPATESRATASDTPPNDPLALTVPSALNPVASVQTAELRKLSDGEGARSSIGGMARGGSWAMHASVASLPLDARSSSFRSVATHRVHAADADTAADRKLQEAVTTMHSALERSGWGAPVATGYVHRLLAAVEHSLCDRQRTPSAKESVREAMAQECGLYLDAQRKRRNPLRVVSGGHRFRGEVYDEVNEDILEPINFYSELGDQGMFIQPFPLNAPTAGSHGKLVSGPVTVEQTSAVINSEVEGLRPIRALDGLPLWPEGTIDDLSRDTASLIMRHSGKKSDQVPLWAAAVVHMWTYELHHRVLWAVSTGDSWALLPHSEGTVCERSVNSGLPPQYTGTDAPYVQSSAVSPVNGLSLFMPQAPQNTGVPASPMSSRGSLQGDPALLRYSNEKRGTPLSPIHDPAAWLPPLAQLLEPGGMFTSDRLPPPGLIEYALSRPVSESISSEEVCCWCTTARTDNATAWRLGPLANRNGPAARLVRTCINQRNQRRYRKDLDDSFRHILKTGVLSEDRDEQRNWSLVKKMFLEKVSMMKGLDPDHPTPSNIAHALGVQVLHFQSRQYLLALDATLGESPVVARVDAGMAVPMTRLASLCRAQLFAEMTSAMRAKQSGESWPKVHVFSAGEDVDGSYEAVDQGRGINVDELVYYKARAALIGGPGLVVHADVDPADSRSQDTLRLTAPGSGFVLRTSIGLVTTPRRQPVSPHTGPTVIPEQICRFTYGQRLLFPLLRTIWLLDQGLRVLPSSPDEKKNYRGLANIALPRDVYFTGNVVLWAAPSASSADQGIATGFTEGDDGEAASAAVFTLRGKSCRLVAPWSRFGREREWLYLPNTNFEVLSLLTDDQREILGRDSLQLLEMREMDAFEAMEFQVRKMLTAGPGMRTQLPVVRRHRMKRRESTGPDSPLKGKQSRGFNTMWSSLTGANAVRASVSPTRWDDGASQQHISHHDSSSLSAREGTGGVWAASPSRQRREGDQAALSQNSGSLDDIPATAVRSAIAVDTQPSRLGQHDQFVPQLFALGAAIHEKDPSRALSVVFGDGVLMHTTKGAKIVDRLRELGARGEVASEALLVAAASGDVDAVVRLVGEYGASTLYIDQRLGLAFRSVQELLSSMDSLTLRKSGTAPPGGFFAEFGPAPRSPGAQMTLHQLLQAEEGESEPTDLRRFLFPLATRYPMLNAALMALGPAGRRGLSDVFKVRSHRDRILTLLHRAGAFVTDLPGTAGGSVFHAAARHGRAVMTAVLAEIYICETEHVTAPALYDAYGWTPLHVAARQGHVAVVRELLHVGHECSSVFSAAFKPLAPVVHVVSPVGWQLELGPPASAPSLQRRSAATVATEPVPQRTETESTYEKDVLTVVSESTDDHSFDVDAVIAPMIRALSTANDTGSTAAHLAWQAQQEGRIGAGLVLSELKRAAGMLPSDIVKVPLWVQVSGVVCFLTLPLLCVAFALPWCEADWVPPDVATPFVVDYTIWDLCRVDTYEPYGLLPGQWVNHPIKGSEIRQARHQTSQASIATSVLMTCTFALLLADFVIAVGTGCRLEAHLRLTVAHRIKRLAGVLPYVCGVIGLGAGMCSVGVMIYASNWVPLGWSVRPGFYCAAVAFLVSVIHASLVFYMHKPSRSDNQTSYWL
eukprot:TRINITY_DN21350_c0_g1_i1.p1 TRINITY_DN21350_c0_g1~~TRINITY_DN21350_c0_g1_i1.p1  ORF type:complete len:1638 (+),score=502.29 TRINITY_DN21350_c0_g1_i1:126-5039(+)